jgi:hypothetical protein
MSLFIAPLDKRFISITGPDASKFLQGQTSCDLNELDENHFSYSTLNTPKGRMYCLFKVLKIENGFLLSMNESLLEPTLQKLSKYAAFFKCELKEDISFQAFGITTDSEDSFTRFLDSIKLNKKALSACVKENDTYCLTLSYQNKLAETWFKKDTEQPTFLNQSTTIKPDHWFALETALGIPELYSSSQEEFILQTLNLHHLRAVSFKKGCYTGQEIIARMKFLGKQKKQTYLLQSKLKSVQAPLTAIYDKDGSKRGTLVRSHWSLQTGSVALCILSIEDALSHKALYLNSEMDIPFTVSEIDYKEFEI